MRRCFEHAQLRRHFHCYRFRTPLPPRRLLSYRVLPRAKPLVRHALSSACRRLSASAGRASIQYASQTACPDFPSPTTSDEREAKVTPEKSSEPDNVRDGHLAHWVTSVEQFLPGELSRAEKHELPMVCGGRSDINKLLAILIQARDSGDVDVLSALVLSQRRYKAAIHLLDVLLNPLAALPSVPVEEQLPSNIKWPISSFSGGLRRPIELDREAHVDKRAALALVRASQSKLDDRDRQTVLQIVWPFLAKLVIVSSRRPPDEAKDIMNTVHQVLARLHNLNLVPSSVYAYALPQGTATVQKPPILNLLNSRILSTLSDAVWRAQQDDAIAQALKDGKPFREVSHHPPGGRFRLKVRELGPEVWLEFVLWCCVEGGLTSAGTRIMNLLREDGNDRWSAVHWTAGQTMDNETPQIDWDRVKRRLGGPVGQREAYSEDQPFVEMPPKTISAEVVLALVESLINNIGAGPANDGSSMDGAAREIYRLLSFLEPHKLSPAYFDYLTVRFLQTETVRMHRGPDTLRDWAISVSQLRSLATVRTRSRSGADFDLDAIIERSEMQAGVLHQALQVYIHLNLVTKAVDTFTDIQKLVDGSKLEAIGDFLSLAIRPRDGFFTSRPRGHIDFTNSHGQLPMYKLAPFLKLVADAKLFGLGDWLLFSEDVDGPLIPPSAYRQPSIAIALCRYAAAKGDHSLIQSILMVRRESRRRLTVNLLRALINFHVLMRDWDTTTFFLQELKAAEGGGYSPSNVANLAALILRIESEPASHDRDSNLHQATAILQDILAGRYNSAAGSFRIDQKVAFRRQTGLLLRLLGNVADSGVQAISDRHRRLFPMSNEALLSPDTFNTVLSAIVDTRGALEGRRMWDIFCKVPASEAIPSAGGGESHDMSGVLFGNDQQPLAAGTNGGSESVPFESVETEEDSSTSPIVVPNVRTLQILVRGAMAEKKAQSAVREETDEELDEILRWARALFQGFRLSEEDIDAELRMKAPLPKAFTRRSRNLKRRKPRQALRERNMPDIGSQFTNAAFIPKPPMRRGRKLSAAAR